MRVGKNNMFFNETVCWKETPLVLYFTFLSFKGSPRKSKSVDAI